MQHAGVWCSDAVWSSTFTLYLVCTGGGGTTTICTDQPPEENRCVYFKHSNSLKYLPSSLLFPCSWCTHYCWKWCSNTERRVVGGWKSQSKRGRWEDRQKERKRDSERRRRRENHGGIRIPQSLPLALFPPSSLLMNRWNITVKFGFILPSFMCSGWDCLWMYYDPEVGKFVCMEINVCVSLWDRSMLPPQTHRGITVKYYAKNVCV